MLAGAHGTRADDRDEIVVGDAVDKVYRVLGQPRGYIRSDKRELLMYERGRIEVRHGLVFRASLVSEEEAQARRIEEEQRRRRRAAAMRARRQRLQAEGLALKEEKLADPVFLSSPVSAQLEFWRLFREKYPHVNVDAEYAHSLARRREEVEWARFERHVADLEDRLDHAERRAREAEREADEARSRRWYYDHYASPLVQVCRPRVIVRPASRCKPVRPCRPVKPCGSPRPVVRPGVSARSPFMWQHDYFGHSRRGSLSCAGSHGGSHISLRVGL
jgi:hypothetical protein